MAMIPKATKIRLKPEQRAELETWLRASTTEQRFVRRARIVLLAAKGNSTRRIAREVGVEPATVTTWRTRFAKYGIDGLKDKPRPGKRPVYGEAKNKRILAQLDDPPPKGYVRWTAKLLAKALGDIHEQYIWRFLRAQNIHLAGRKCVKGCIRNGSKGDVSANYDSGY
jgi:transposase